MNYGLLYTIGGLLLIFVGSSTIIAATMTEALMDYFGNMAMQEFYRKKAELSKTEGEKVDEPEK